MNLADIRKRHRLDEIKKTSTHMLDDIRTRHNLGKVSTTRKRVEEILAKPRLYKNEAEYYAKNDYSAGRAKYDELLKKRTELDAAAKELETETYQGSRKGPQYLNWMRDREARMEANKADREKTATTVADWDEFYGKGSLYGYNELAKNEDFAERSRAIIPEYISKGLTGIDLMLSGEYGKSDTVYNYINDIGNTREAVNEAKDPTSEFGQYDNMTDDERRLYTYIHNTQGAEEANTYLGKLELGKRGFEKTQQADAQFAQEHPVAAWLLARTHSGYLGAQAGLDLLAQGIRKAVTGEDINFYSSAQALHAGKGAVDAAVAEKAQEAVPITIAGIDMAKLAVSAFSSGIDSLTSSLLPGGAGAVALALDAGISSMRTAAQNGATDGQALLKGLSSAVFEYVFENVSIGNFKAMQEKGISGWKDVFANITKSMGVNMTEEMATEAANIAYDLLLGYDYSELQGASGRELLKQVVEAGLSGALMGIGFGAVGNISSGVQFQQFKNEWTEEVKQQLIDNGATEEDAEKSAKLLFEMAMEAEKQSGQIDTEVQANADFAKPQTDESRQQTTNDTIAEENRAERATEAFTGMVARYADSMDANGQNVFVELYDGSVEPDVYVSEMRRAYDAGRNGTELTADDTASVDQGKLDLAYKAGQADERTANAGFGFVYNESSRRLTGTKNQQMFRNFDRLGRDLKVKIQFADSVRGNTANGSYRNGVITVSVKAENPYLVVAKHEITHHLKQTAAKSFGAYESYAVETFAKSLGLSADALVQDRIAEAARSGDRLTAEQAREEIAADFTEAIFTNEKTLRRFVEVHAKSAEGRNMLQRLFDAIRRFIAKLKSGRMDYSVGSKQGLTVEQLEKAERLYREVLAESAQQRTGVSGDGGKTMYSLREIVDKNNVSYGIGVYLDSTLLDNLSDEERKKMVKEYVKELGGSIFTAYDPNGKAKEITIAKHNQWFVNHNGKKKPVNKDLINKYNNNQTKQEAIALVDELIITAGYDGKKPANYSHDWLDNNGKNDWEYWTTYVQDKNNTIWEVTMNVANTTDGAKVLYDIDPIKRVGQSVKSDTSLPNANIPQPDTSVKSKLSTKGGGLDALIKQYGEIEPGENPTREAHVPTRTEEKKWVSQTIRTVIEAGATPDVVLPNIEQIIAAGDVSREAYGDDAAIDKAKNKLKYDGWDKTISAWYNAVKKGEVSKDLTTMGWVLYNNAVNEAKNEKDAEKRKAKIKSSLDIIMAMVGHQRNAAQALQATRILKKLSPEAQLYGIMQSVRSLQDELEKKFKDKAPDLKIDYVLAERLLTATSDKARDDAMHDIYRDIGRQMPSTFLDKWNAWRYLAMLGNVRTHGRNIAGNAAFMPLVGMKNAVATGLEKAVYTFGGQRLQRTKGIPSKELLQAAYRDYSKLTDKERAGEKYNDNANANEWIEEGRQIFKPKLLEGARKLNSELLTREDEWFIKPHYALALAQYCKANGITAQMIAEGKGLDKARRYAVKEAQKATYRDANAVSEAVSKLGKYKGDNVALKAGSLFVDAVLPFRKTPANILVRAVEYSPIGLIKSVSADLVRMKQGKISGAQVIDNFAAGLTGTALMGLGVLLSKLGLVIGMGSDDEDERKFSELQGYQGYAIVFDDRTYTVDWLAPEALPFFVGVNLAELKAFEELSVPEMVTALTNITAPMLEMSCLQGLNDMIEAAGSVQGKGVSAMMQMVSNAATSYLTQALPTLFGQAERITETTRQQTYTYKDSKLLTPNMQYTLGKAFNKLPGDIAQIPYIDAWGRETSTGNVGARAFNNLLNPGYSAKIRTSDMEKELQRLYDETGEKSVLPDRAQKYISVGGEKIYLTKNQYVKYATVKGQTSYDLLTRITASAQYKALDEADKVKIIEKVYTYANAYAKAEVTKTRSIKAERYVPDGWIAEAISTTKRTGIPVWKYILIYNGQTGITGLKDKDGETIPLSSSLKKMEYVYSFIGLSTEQRNAIFADFGVAESVQHYSKARVLQKLEEMEKKAAK